MIKAVDASTLRGHMKAVLEEIEGKRDFMLVMRKSKPVGAILNIDFLEDLLARTSPEYLRSIRAAREDAKRGRLQTHADLFGRVG